MSRLLSALAFTLSLAGSAFALDGDVTLTLKVAKQKDNRVQLSGKTNLPPGTKVMLSVEEKMDNGFMGQSSCFIADDGTFESESFGPNGGLSHGRYVANATMPIPAVQPANVKRIIGDKGEKLTGPLVEKGTFGVTVSQTTAFSIGENADEAQAARKQEADAATAALKQKTCVLLQQLLKFKDDPKFKEYGFAIGGPYNKWLKSVESLRDSTPTGLRNPIPFVVRTAPGDLLILGMDYMQKGETDFTRQRLPELKKTIGYDDFLNPKAKSIAKTKTKKPTSESRTWHDSTGKFSVDATLVATTETHVVLRKTDGKTVQVPITKLSAADVEFVNRKPSP